MLSHTSCFVYYLLELYADFCKGQIIQLQILIELGDVISRNIQLLLS